MKKRIIQLILALCMLLALLTMNVMAAEPDLTVDKDGNKYFVIVKNSPSTDFHICTAYYDENGRFMEMKEWAKNLGGIHPTLPEGVAYVKAFLWGANTYVPLCEAKELSFLPVHVAANFYDGDNLIDTKTVTLDETYGELPTPTREGYEFLGWYTAAEGGERVTASTKVTAETEISLYAHWRKMKFQISLYDGEALIETRTVNRGEAYGELPVLTREDKAIFLGWFTAAEGGEQVTASTKATGENDIVLHAHWREQNIAVSFYDGETLIETRTVNYGEPYGELPVLTGEDESEFLGWFTAAEGGEQVTAETAVTADSEVFLYARWKNLKKIPASIFDFDAAEVFTFTYGEDYEPKARSATYTYTREAGETYTKSQFEIKYKRQGSTEYEAGNPGNAGTYDVTITRPADDTYAAFEHTYEGVLVINKGTHSSSFVKVMIADRGYTWFEFEVAKFGQWQYEDFSREEATITYYVSPDKVKVYQSEPGSNQVRLPEHLGADYNVRIEITNDPNWEDWNSGWLLEYYLNYTGFTKARYNLMPYPTQSWREADIYDTGWYSSDSTEFVITTPEQLAGLAYMVNNGGNSFAGKTVKLGNDINLIGYVWEPIGNGSTQFQGTFDGQNHFITGLYMSGNATYTGLFGYTSGSSSAYVEIKNLKLDDSDISGVHKANYAGGIVGLAKRTRLVNCVSYAAVSCNKEGSAVGGMAGAAENVEIFDCINYGYLAGMGNVGGIAGKTSAAATISSCINRGIVTSAMNACGGIVGRSTGSTQVANCINDGEVSTTNNSEDFGGIVGLVESGKVYNCANHGYVKAYRCVGGIVGRNLIDGQIYNCYSGITGNYLHVYGTATSQFYVGAIVGRNQKDEGSVDACYYLLSSAKNYNGFVDGAGTKSGSTNNVPNLDIGYYHGWTTNVEGYWYGYNGGDSSTKAPLIELLNRWQNDHAYGGYILANWWVGTVEGYPLPNLTIW